MTDGDLLGPAFENAPVPDPWDRDVWRGLQRALAELRGGGEQDLHPIVAGQAIERPFLDALTVWDPLRPGRRLAGVGGATVADVEAAFRAAEAFTSAPTPPLDERMDQLRRMEASLVHASDRLAAMLVVETGKSWLEAAGEVAEAIDFVRYHAHRIVALMDRDRTALTSIPGEASWFRSLPLGIGVALLPWPFPLAQAMAVTSAAVATGNAVLVKPSERSPRLAHWLVRAWLDAGVDPRSLALLPGTGPDLGRRLVRDPRIAFVAATGSAATGRAVYASASAAVPHRVGYVQPILELSGSNAIIVDETADVDAAAAAIVEGAFSFTGQKCSKASRLLVVASVAGDVMAAVQSEARRWTAGDPTVQGVDLGPLIDDAARERFHAACHHWSRLGDAVELPVQRAEADVGGPPASLPTIVQVASGVESRAVAETPGPLLLAWVVRDFEEALRCANAVPYAQTGSLFSSSEARLHEAPSRLSVGTIYLNRKPTGSVVGRSPFGGFGASGTNAKAGGPEYLARYLTPQTVVRVS